MNAQDWEVVQQGPDADGARACAVINDIDVPERTIRLGSIPGPQSAETQVTRRISALSAECIDDRYAARATADRALRDLGLTDWTVTVTHGNWDANSNPDHPEPDTVELCASFDVSERTVYVNSVLRERESGWRRFVPGL